MRKWRSAPIVCLVLLLGPVFAGVMVQTAGAQYALSVTPANPTSQDVITLTLAGTWSDNCPPNKLRAELKEGSIYIDMLLPGAEDGQVPVSKPIKTDWQVSTTIGPLPAGTYRVYSRGVAYEQVGGYAKVGEIQVLPAASQPDPSPPAPEAPSEPPAEPDPSPPTPKAPSEPPAKPDPSPPAPKAPSEPPAKPDPSPPTVPGTGSEPKSGAPAELIPAEGLRPAVGVVLMDAAFLPNSGLEAGRCGTIIGSEWPGRAGMVLVSWHFYRRGTHDRYLDPDGIPIAIPRQSAQWIDTQAVPLAIRFDESGTLIQGQGHGILCRTEDGRLYNLIGAHLLNEKIGPTGQFHFGDRVRVQGLLQACGPRTSEAAPFPRQKGDVYGPAISLHIPAQADCIGTFAPPDRVVLLVDNPPGLDGKPATGLRAGAQGTIVYIDPTKPNAIFVSWDDFTKGMNAADFSPPPVPPCPPKSAWPVTCALIEPGSEARGPCSGDTLTFSTFDSRVWLKRGPQCPGGRHTLRGSTTVGIESSESQVLGISVTPFSGIGGTWKAALSTDTVNANKPTSVQITITVENINLSTIRIGEDVLAARINFWSQPQ